LLGYTREELLGRTDAEITPNGMSSLTCKDGSTVPVTCIQGQAVLAGMPVSVSVLAAASTN